MINFEQILIPSIVSRFKKLRNNEGRKIKSEIISYGQKSAILKIEKAGIPKSGNFVSDRLLEDYASYFDVTKEYLIFGNCKEVELHLFRLFFAIFVNFVSDDFEEFLHKVKSVGKPNKKILESFEEFLYVFGDFGRWYKIKRFEKDAISTENIDYDSMFKIFWLLSRETIVLSFQSEVITKLIDESGSEKFVFTKINTEVDRWLKDKVAKFIIPNMVKRLKSDSVFKIGFMVKNLIDEFLVNNLKPDYHTKIPMKRFIPPMPSYDFHFKGNESQDVYKKIAEEWVRMQTDFHNLNESDLSNDEKFKIMEQNQYFEGIEQITNKSKPFINDEQAVYAEEFLDSVLSQPRIDGYVDHRLNRVEQKIPGMLQENNKAQKLFQEKINKMTLSLIDELVDYQNTFISCIDWKELPEYM
ncbi:hypothetical protein LGW20_09220 [Streptococcus mutans]|uniref:hypothetical protein n=1 Tax=Streptococcus mutans TaxID=1309 RepID=UPI0001B0575C|nr:hypothetical protein [Streptococcus mutans]MCB4945926.1 hypothetical protein [Streptococcus mutans]MCB4958955.1 hypothetical protein [Streptococcus mutans]MCB4968505.1 hypothetical protein [Streptococcus mutans]MCB5026293.1 hypothetical protein [Streptococcus mutans]MCB5032864.1 hypothetical protein [Streptococcus mutans]